MIFSKKKNINNISLSITQKRWMKFKSMKRGYYSFLIITFLYALSWILPVLINNKAIVVSYEGNYYFPAIHDFSLVTNKTYLGNDFGQDKTLSAVYA